MGGAWMVAHTYRGDTRQVECETERSAHQLSTTLPGVTEVYYQYALMEETPLTPESNATKTSPRNRKKP